MKQKGRTTSYLSPPVDIHFWVCQHRFMTETDPVVQNEWSPEIKAEMARLALRKIEEIVQGHTDGVLAEIWTLAAAGLLQGIEPDEASQW